MKNELAVYVEPEVLNEERSEIEMRLYAELQGWTSTPEQIDRPADQRLIADVRKAQAEDGSPAPIQAAAPSAKCGGCHAGSRVLKYGFTITDFILLLIAGLLFLNIVTK